MPSTVDTPLGKVVPHPYPGRIIKAGEQDKTVVETLQTRLNEIGCGLIEVDGDFRKETKAAVRLFQTRFTDTTGAPLKIDGEIGPIGWAVLFGTGSVPSSEEIVPDSAALSIMQAAVDFARTQIGIMESPLGSNRGPEVDEYVRAAGLSPSGKFAWCVAFTHFCYLKAAASVGKANPHIKTASVLAHWNKAKDKPNIIRVTTSQALANPALIKPGSLFIIDLGGGLGHSGIVTATANGFLDTIEGNTNDNGSRNGIGVFKRNSRKINQINKGFIDYSNF